MKTILSAAIGALLALSVMDAGAQAKSVERKVNLTIEQQSLADALNEWAKQTGLQLVSPSSELMNSTLAPRIKGEYTAKGALEELLKGTTLTYQWVSERAVAIREKSPVVPAALQPAQHNDGPSLQIARLVDDGERAVPLIAQGNERSSSDPASTPAPTSGDFVGTELEEVVVTGTHIRSHKPIGARVQVITRDDIDRSGFGRLQDVLAKLPQNFASVGEDGQNQTVGDAQLNRNRGTEVQLRGLGSGTTLVLVNGLRQPAGGMEGSFVDVSSIPTAAIERVEILADGASAIYGSDAIGGVVNILLRKDYSGAETRVRLATADGGGEETSISQVLGGNWSTGNLMIGYQYYERSELTASEFEYTAADGDFTRFGGDDFRLPNGNPGTIFDANFEPAFAIPAGQDGSSLSAADLIPGSINYYHTGRSSLLPQQEMNSAFVNLSQQVSDRVELVATARFNRREMESVAEGIGLQLFVPPENAFYFDPFGDGEPTVVAYDFTDDFGPRVESGKTDTYTGALEAIARLGDNWRLVVSGSFGREDNTWVQRGLIDFAGLDVALADSDPATAFNPFGDGSHTNPVTLRSLTMTESLRARSETWSGNATVDGALFTLPGGPVRVAVGGDYRNESLDLTLSTLIAASGPIDQPAPTSDERHVSALFAEFAIPLFGESNRRPGLHELSLSLAGRYEDYSDFGDTFNPKVGLSWQPVDSLRFRGTWGTSFRAPPFFQSSADISPVQYQLRLVTDPQSTTGRSNVLAAAGNNPDLQPEEATVWTAGFDLEPKALPGLSLSLGYFDIDYTDKIGSGPSVRSILLVEDQWAPIITRNPTQAQIDEICSQPLVIGSCTGQPIGAIVDLRLRNLARLQVSGIDLDARYSIETRGGQLGFGVGGSYALSYDRQVIRTADSFDVVDTVGNPVALKLRGDLSWTLGNWQANAAVNYVDDYKVADVPGSPTVGSWTTVDVGVGYEFGPASGLLRSTRLSLGAVNVFDKVPPFVNQPLGYDAKNATVLGRFVSVQLNKAWD